MRHVRFIAYMVGIVLLWTSIALASADESSVRIDGTQIDLLKWGVTQGGLVLVTMIILWSYRRDFGRLLAEQRSELDVITALVKEASAAMTASAAASRDAASAIDRLREGHRQAK